MIRNYFNLVEEHRDKVRSSLLIHEADEFGVKLQSGAEDVYEWYATDGIGKWGPNTKRLSKRGSGYRGPRFNTRETVGVGVLNPRALGRLMPQDNANETDADPDPDPEFNETEWNQHRSRIAEGIEDQQEYLNEVLRMARLVLQARNSVSRYYRTLTVFEAASARERLRHIDNERIQRGMELIDGIITEIESL